MQVSWFLHPQAIVWEPSLSFNSGFRLLPCSKLERRMGQSPRFGPDQKEAWLAKAGAAVQLQRLRQTPLPLAPQPMTALAITENAKHFCLSSLLTQTHSGSIYLKIFHFLFWKVIRVLHVPFITKEAGKRGCVLCHPGKSRRGTLGTQSPGDPTVLYLTPLQAEMTTQVGLS